MLKPVLALVVICFSVQAFASGYEKSIPWGGRSAGLGGIATPYIEGADALFFNPAGLARDKEGQDVSFNISPTIARFSGPINNENETVTSESKLLTPFGLTYSRSINENLGVGIGGYISGGAYANYENVAFSGINGTSTVKTDLQVAELALGAGYKVNDKLKVGLAYRVAMAQADFAIVTRGGPFVFNSTISDLKDTQYNGFKLGAQYQAGENTKLGLTYRSEINFEADGKIQTTRYGPGAAVAGAETDASATTTFPMAVVLGVEHKCSDNWKGLAEYAWTQYSRVDKIVVKSGTTTTDVTQDWRDQHNIRLGSEYLGFALPLRMGYVWTSQVTSPDWARASFTPPGQGHSLTLGTGNTFREAFEVNGGFEYSIVRGTGKGAAAGTGGAGTDIRAGDYKTDAYALHLGLRYNF